MGSSKVQLWVWTHALLAGTSVGFIEKRKVLTKFVGDENIVEERKGFVPPSASFSRSEPAYLFGLNEKGKELFNQGFSGRPTDFHPYYFPLRSGDQEDADPTGPFGGPGKEVPPDILSALSEPTPVLIAQLPGHLLRVIRPGDAITLDYAPSRFNVYLDERDTIVKTGFF